MLFYRIISYLLHPVLFPSIATFLYFIFLPTHVQDQGKSIVLGVVFATTYVIPLVLIFLLKKFKLIENYHLKLIDERKFPTIFMTLLFFLLGMLLLDYKIVDLLAFSFFGCALALIFTYILFSLNLKTSLHTMGISGLIGLICLLSFEYQQNLLIYIVFLFLLFGLIATARLKLKAHSSLEVYLGFFIGLASQLIIYSFYLRFSV